MTREQTMTLSGRRVWLVAVALSAGSFLFMTAETLPIGLLSELSAGLGVSTSAAGQLVTVYALCVVATAVPLTMALSRVDRRRLLVGLLAAFTLANVASAVASTYAVLLVARAVMAMTQAVFWSIAAPLAGRLLPAGQRGRGIAVVYAGISLSLVVGVPAGTAVGHWLGWRQAMVAMAIAGAATLLVLLVTVPSVPGTALGRRGRIALPLRGSPVRRAVAVTAVAFTGVYVALTYLSPLLQDVSGVPESWIQFFLLLFGIAGLGGNVVVGALVDHRLRTTLFLSLGGILAVVVLFGLAGRWLAVAVVAVLLWGMAGAGLPTAFTTWGLRLVPPDDHDALSSLFVVAVNLGIGAGALLGGRLLDGLGLYGVVWSAAGLLTAALAMLAMTTTPELRTEVS
jgi:predicted MFS family arabinose efflux permease